MRRGFEFSAVTSLALLAAAPDAAQAQAGTAGTINAWPHVSVTREIVDPERALGGFVGISQN